MTNLKSVLFINSYRQYNAGEIAGFTNEFAEQLVEGGVAVYHHPPRAKLNDDIAPDDAGKAAEANAAPEPLEEVVHGAVKAVHRGFGRWFIEDTEGNTISGPHKRREMRDKGLTT